jgi:SAM-dependent methyltransferase
MSNTEKPSTTLHYGEEPDLFGPKDWYRNGLLIRRVRKYVKSGAILDYGCGSGNCIGRLLEYGYRCVGIDATEENFRYLQRRFHGNSRFQAFRGDEAVLRRLQEPLDGIVCGETLEHVEDDTALVRLFREKLVPGGYVFLSVPAHQSRWSEIDVFAGHFRRYEKDGLQSLFSDNGFTVEEIFHYGFPLGMIYDRVLGYPIMKRKMKSGTVYSGSRSWLGFILRLTTLKKTLSPVFYLDNVFFPGNKRGSGLIAVAKKDALARRESLAGR